MQSEWVKKTFIDGVEVWPIQSWDDFVEIRNEAVKQGKLSSEQIALIDQARVLSLPRDEKLRFHAVQEWKATGFILVSQDLKSKLSRAFLVEVYRYLLKTKNSLPYLSYDSFQEADRAFEEDGLDAAAREKVLQHLFEIDGRFYLFTTPDASASMDLDYLTSTFHYDKRPLNPADSGLVVALRFDQSDDLAAIAEKYAGGRDPKPIERLLRKHLSRSKSGKGYLPLDMILQPFLRSKFGRFSTCAGPNCFNTGPNVNLGKRWTEAKETTDAELIQTVRSNYTPVGARDEMRSGDLMIYTDEANEVVHVATYVDEGLVFVKNGTSKFRPYIFQALEAGEEIYFPRGRYRLRVFRVRGPELRSGALLPRFRDIPAYRDTTIGSGMAACIAQKVKERKL